MSKFRHPLDFKMKIMQVVFFSVVMMIIFNDLGEGFDGIQNRNGALYFFIMCSGMVSFNSSLSVFLEEKPVYIRESLNKTYSTVVYFFARSLIELVEYIAIPLIQVLLIYWTIGFDFTWNKVFKMLYAGWATYWCGSAYGLWISSLVPNIEVAMAIQPIIF